MARVLITGGTGFIGSHLVRDCLRRGDQVTVLSRPNSSHWRLESVLSKIDLRPSTLYDQAELLSVLDEVRPHRIFHLAAATRIPQRASLSDLEHGLICNVEPVRILINAMRKLKLSPQAIVRAGSLAEIGESDGIATPDSCERPADAYGLSALMCSHLLRIARERVGMPAVSARLCLTYGGDQSGEFLIPDMIRKGLSGISPRLRRPQARRDLIYIDDAVAALQLIADHAATLPPVVTVATGQPVAMSQTAGLIADLLGRPATTKTPPAAGEPASTLSSQPSPELVDLGWKPRMTLANGLRRTIEWERGPIVPFPQERSA